MFMISHELDAVPFAPRIFTQLFVQKFHQGCWNPHRKPMSLQALALLVEIASEDECQINGSTPTEHN